MSHDFASIENARREGTMQSRRPGGCRIGCRREQQSLAERVGFGLTWTGAGFTLAFVAAAIAAAFSGCAPTPGESPLIDLRPPETVRNVAVAVSAAIVDANAELHPELPDDLAPPAPKPQGLSSGAASVDAPPPPEGNGPRATSTESLAPEPPSTGSEIPGSSLPTIPPSPAESPAAATTTDSGAALTPDVGRFCHVLRVGRNGGSCECIGPRTYVSCQHVASVRGRVYVEIGESGPVAATVTPHATLDVAIIQLDQPLAGHEAAPFSTEAPAYMAEATVCGMVSGQHTGFVSDNETLSLPRDQPGIQKGDSGGGVFVDGTLVGILRTRNPGNHQVCYFTPLSNVAALVAPFTPAAFSADQPGDAPGADDNRPVVTVYATAGDWCDPCNTVKEWADDPDLPFRVQFIYDDPAHQSIPYIEWYVGSYRWWFGQQFTPTKANVVSSWKATQPK